MLPEWLEPARQRLVERAAACLLVASAVACGATDATDPNGAFVPGVVVAGVTSSLTVKSGSLTREYLLHDVQSAGTSKTPLPLIILLHGSGLAAADMRSVSAMDSIADSRHFLVAYPQGTGSPSDWNAGNCCGDPSDAHIDDIAFIRGVIADISSRLVVDPKRIYVGGFSDGARMAYRVGCEMSGQVAAIAVVSGSLVTPGCAPSRLVPLIAFHGTADASVIYGEATATAFPRTPPSGTAGFPPAIRFWMATASCRSVNSTLFAPTTVKYTGNGCGADVAFYETFGGIHAWPVAVDSETFDASPLIVEFFQAHKLP